MRISNFVVCDHHEPVPAVTGRHPSKYAPVVVMRNRSFSGDLAKGSVEIWYVRLEDWHGLRAMNTNKSGGEHGHQIIHSYFKWLLMVFPIWVVLLSHYSEIARKRFLQPHLQGTSHSEWSSRPIITVWFVPNYSVVSYQISLCRSKNPITGHG